MIKDSALTRTRYQTLSLQWQDKLANTVGDSVLKQAANYITPDDYDSIVEERAADGLCGYPICGRNKQKLEQRFSISLAHRKIYDITEQGSYCSRECMASSRLYRHQLTDEPLYMRDQSKQVDIVLMAMDRSDEKAKGVDSAIQKSTQHASAAGGTTEENDAMAWYKKTLIAKMNIPENIAKSNPLKIVEHESKSTVEDISDVMSRLQFADIEGFEPEFDVKSIKKSIKKIKKTALTPAVKKSRDHTKSDAVESDGEILKVSIGPKDGNPNTPGFLPSTSAGETSASEFEKDDDDDDDDDSSVLGAASDNGYFMDLFSSEIASYGGAISSSTAPPLSLFGRMWTLIDRIATNQTIKYLGDLKKCESDSGMSLNISEYYSSPGDTSMMMRQNLFSDNTIIELDKVRAKLRIARDLRHELRTLVSTLELSSKMVVFKKPEQQLLGIVLLLALARSIDSLRKQLEAGSEAARELDRIMDGLGTDRGSMNMVSRRFHEPY
ncbi:hypothetical protein EV178_000863 [Coemansia sp. RSA 1646]|nr:hypothetical protein EV178_000863 [Coemansia sp. RSA 1646]